MWNNYRNEELPLSVVDYCWVGNEKRKFLLIINLTSIEINDKLKNIC